MPKTAFEHFVDPSLTIPRWLPGPPHPASELVAGAAERDITPTFGLALAGIGPADERRARGVWGRLRVVCLFVRDRHGSAIALISVDLLAGSRYLVEYVAAAVGPRTGLTVDRIFLSCSHTHAAPGGYFGSGYYDRLASTTRGFDAALSRAMGDRIAEAVIEAHDSARPARIGYGRAAAWDLVWQRSMPAFARNRDFARAEGSATGTDAKPREWESAVRQLNGVGAFPPLHPNHGGATAADPDGTDAGEAFRAVDARVHALAATDAGTGALIGAFVTCSATPSALHGDHHVYSNDVFGHAARLAGRRLGGEAPIAAAASLFGDANLVHPRVSFLTFRQARARPLDSDLSAPPAAGSSSPATPSPDPSTEVAARRRASLLDHPRDIAWALGDTFAEAIDRASDAARSSDRSQTVTIRYEEARVRGARLGSDRKLAEWPMPGTSTFSGSELNAQSMSFGEGETASGHGHGAASVHGTKRELSVAGIKLYKSIAAWLGESRFGLLPPFWPLRVARVGGLTLVGLPAEPSLGTGVRLARALGEAADAPVVVLGNCGDYQGYLTTRAEYSGQHYEGASTLWGQYTCAWLVERIARLADGPPTPAPGGAARFATDQIGTFEMQRGFGSLLARGRLESFMPTKTGPRVEYPELSAPAAALPPREPLRAELVRLERAAPGADGFGRRALRVKGWWATSQPSGEIPLSDAALVTFYVARAGAGVFTPLELGGRAVTDRSDDIYVRGAPSADGGFYVWAFDAELALTDVEAAGLAGARIAYQVGPSALRPADHGAFDHAGVVA